MSWVIDCSMALAWGLPDEQSPVADDFFTTKHFQQDMWVPALWWFEFANALKMGKKRKRITEDQYIRLLQAYTALPIQTDTNAGFDFVHTLQQVASQYDLSGYDAAYLELALRNHAGLATLDSHLANKARQAGVSPVFPA